MEKKNQFPSRLQSRILAAMYTAFDDYVTTEIILKQTGIAQSTWSEEQNRLIEDGLLEKRQAKVMSSNVITRIMNYKLTDKGRLVAHNLTNISRIMAPHEFLANLPLKVEKNGIYKLSDDNGKLSSVSIDETVQECVEVGLESFGMNLDKLVKEEVEAAGMQWTEISKSPEKLVDHLVNLFGRNGALTIEQMISANVKSRFGLYSIFSNNLVSIVSELKASYLQKMNKDLKS